MTTTTKRVTKATTKPSNSTKPTKVEPVNQIEKDVFKLLVEAGKLENKQVSISDKLLTIAKLSDSVDEFLMACRNAEKSYKEISKENTIPRAWSQTKSDIKAMFDTIKDYDTISQLKKVKNHLAAEKRKADKAAKANEQTDKANTTKVLTDKSEILAKILSEMPATLADEMLEIFIQQANTALQTVKETPKATKPKASNKKAS